MSMLGAFFRGALGPGLMDMSRRMDARDAAASEDERRKREREEERAWREREAEKDREARYGRERSAAVRSGGGGGGGDGGDGGDNYLVAQVMKDNPGISIAQAQALVESSRAGQNPLQRQESVTDTIDDGDRKRNVTRQEMRPDMERWAKINASIAEAMQAGPSMARSNYDQLEGGRGKAQVNTIGAGMLSGAVPVPQAAEGIAALSGKGAYGNAKTNEFTGTPTAIGQSEVAENMAQAGSAGRANRDTGPGDPLSQLKLPPGVKASLDQIKKRAEQVNAAITKAQADGSWEPETNQGQARLEQELSALDKEARKLLTPYLPKQEVDPKAARAEAEAAVAAGAPLDKVNARLKELGLPAIGNGAAPAAPAAASAPGAAAKPDASSKPGLLDRLSMGIGDAVDAVKASADIPATLKRRIEEAKAGGKPLTPGEIQLAAKYGIKV